MSFTLDEEKQLLKIYKFGMDKVIQAGRCSVPGPYILLRGITEEEIANKAHGLETATEGDIRKAIFFEIIQVGPLAKKAAEMGSFSARVGDHCMHISAAGDPVEPEGKCKHILVHWEDICLSWSPRAVLTAG